MNFSLIKKVTKYVLFLGVIFGGLAVTFIQAEWTPPNLINIEGGNINVSDGNINLDSVWPYNCNSDLWFCEEGKRELCTSSFPDEDYIVVARTDSGSRQWKTSQTYCLEPQCVDGVSQSGTGMVLTNEHDVDFSEYPARNTCKSYGVGARMPTSSELLCIYNNRSEFGTFSNNSYWSATETSETSAYNYHFQYAAGSSNGKNQSYRVRCVLGYSL